MFKAGFKAPTGEICVFKMFKDGAFVESQHFCCSSSFQKDLSEVGQRVHKTPRVKKKALPKPKLIAFFQLLASDLSQSSRPFIYPK